MKRILKAIYKAIPFKKQIFIVLKSIWRPPRAIYQHLYFKGSVKIKVGPTASFKMYHYGYQLENDLFWSGINGNWEKSSLDIWKKLSVNASVIFDIGANTGVYSLLSKAVNQNAQVFAFEPISRIYHKMLDNVKLNGYDIHCSDKAISDKTGMALIFDNGSEHEYTATLQDNTGKTYTRSKEIATTTIDQLVKDFNLTRLDLVKIDVEAHEPAVLRGFSKNISRFRPSILIEILNNKIAKSVEELLNNNGEYYYFNIPEDSGPRVANHISFSKGGNYLICTGEKANYLGLL